MSEQLKESLSAVMDGEAETFEVRRVLDECAKNDALAQTWARYHLIGALIRGESSERKAPMSDAIWEALDNEHTSGDEMQAGFSADAGDKPGLAKRVLGPVAGAAVAATVALGIVLGFDTNDATENNTDIVIASPVDDGSLVAAEVRPSDVQRANAYYMHHVRATSMNNPAGILRFTRAVSGSFDEE